METYEDNNEQETTGDAFLDNYLEEQTEAPPVQREEEFDNLEEEEEEEEEFDNPYSISSVLSSLIEEEESVENIEDSQATDSFLDNLLNSSFDPNTATQIRETWGKDGVRDIASQKFKSVHEEIVVKESNGDYGALPIRNGKLVSSAVGKYQFLWKTWGDPIKKATGVSSKEEFRQNPDAQDYFYNEVYVPKHVLPWVAQVKRHLRTNVSDEQLIKLYHFRGAEGALNYLRGELENKPESYNSPISTYTGIAPGVRHLKTGGWVYAQIGLTEEQQRQTLNSYSMNFTPIKPPKELTEEIYSVEGLNDNSVKLAHLANSGLTPENTFDYNDAQKVADVAAVAAGTAQTVLGAASSIRDLKGKAMSTTLSGLSAASNDRLARLREQAELQKMYANLQDNFDDSTTDTLGQTKNIWDI